MALAVVFALTPAEKVWLLTAWLLWLILIFVALVVIESLRYSFERQMKLETMSDASLIGLYDASAAVRAASSGDGPAEGATVADRAGAEADGGEGVPGAFPGGASKGGERDV